MIRISQPDFHENPMMGLLGPSVSFEVSEAPDAAFGADAVDMANTLIGEWKDPDMPIPGILEPEGRSRALLGWVYRACEDADWPVFQTGTFEPAGESDLDGRYFLPSRLAPPLLPFRLFRLLLNALLTDARDWDKVTFEGDLSRLIGLLKQNGLAGNNQRWVLHQISRRGHSLNEIKDGTFQIGHGPRTRFVRGTVDGQASQLLTEIQTDKTATSRLLGLHGIPTVEHIRVETDAQAIEAAEVLGYPVVLKPHNLSMGRGVIADIRSAAQLQKALDVRGFDIKQGLIEKYVPGDMARIAIFKNQIVEVRVTELSHVTGDGVSTFEALTRAYAEAEEDQGNTSLKLKTAYDSLLARMALIGTLEKHDIQLGSIIEAGRKIQILDHPTRRRGSRVQWLTGEALCEPYLKLAHRIQTLFGGAPLGIDLLAFNNEHPEQTVVGEVNFGPGLDFEHVRDRFLDVFEL